MSDPWLTPIKLDRSLREKLRCEAKKILKQNDHLYQPCLSDDFEWEEFGWGMTWEDFV